MTEGLVGIVAGSMRSAGGENAFHLNPSDWNRRGNAVESDEPDRGDEKGL